jgi:hypothetical protein
LPDQHVEPGRHHHPRLARAGGAIEHHQLNIGIEEELHRQGLLRIAGREAEDRSWLVGDALAVPVLGEAEVLHPLELRVDTGQDKLFPAVQDHSHVPQEVDRLSKLDVIDCEPPLSRSAAVEEPLHRFFGNLTFDHATIDLVDVFEADLAVAQVLGGDRQRVAFEEEIGILGDHDDLVARMAVRPRHLGDALSAGEDVIVPGLRAVGLEGPPVRLPGEDASSRGSREGLRVGLVLKEALDAVVNELVAPVLEHLPHHQAGRVAHALRLGTRCLQPPQLLDHLVQKHHHVATGEKSIEGVGVFDQGRGVWDVHRAG